MPEWPGTEPGKGYSKNVGFSQHINLERNVFFEFVRPGGTLVDIDVGNTFIPGHAIESMWFMERVYRKRPERAARMERAKDVSRWHLEQGWDAKLEGLFPAWHAKGAPRTWHQPDAKVRWPHTEAFSALLRLYELFHEPWMMDWYWKLHEYTFRVFLDREHGDWHKSLGPAGPRTESVIKNLAVNDPFHLPRALIYAIVSLRGLAGPT